MKKNSTRTFSWYGRPGWRGLAASMTLVLALVLMTGVVFAQPDSRPFATPSTASEGADNARWVAQGEYYAAMWEASAVASTMRYQAMAASLGAGTGSSIQAAANPSMNVAQWYAPGVVATSGDSLFALNPELAIASRWTAGNAGLASGSALSLNPELMLVQNWEASRAAVEGQDQLCTPEDYVC